MCLTRCDQTEQATLSGGYLILEKFRVDFPHITSLIKRSDNASILAGQTTPEGDWSLAKRIGIQLLMRDYSEIQSGKDICDRIVGAAKLRMKAYLHAGHDITTACQIKIGMNRVPNNLTASFSYVHRDGVLRRSETREDWNCGND